MQDGGHGRPWSALSREASRRMGTERYTTRCIDTPCVYTSEAGMGVGPVEAEQAGRQAGRVKTAGMSYL